MKNVLIIGSGVSGLSCAIRCAENGDKAILVSPYPSERSQSVMAAGGINAALNTKGENDSVESHVEDTLRGGCSIASASAVRGMCQAAPDIIAQLEGLGAVFTRKPDGGVDLRAFGGQSHKRTAFAGASTGKQMVTALVLKAREYQNKGLIQREYGLWFHSALLRDGVCYGALFFNQRESCLQAICADAVVMATGGQNALFGKTTGSTLCDGYAAARLFMQGVTLKNLEFIQYHPTTLETAQKRMLISEAARGEGGRLYYNEKGRRVYFMEEQFGEKGNLMPRDVVSRCIYNAPSQVYLDITHLGKKVIRERLFEIKDLCSRYAGIDVEKESIPVQPSVHFFMGGIAVDNSHRTNLQRLYAVGECASIYHGANRLGGNSLLAAMYSGRVAADAVTAEPPLSCPDFSDYVEQQRQQLKELQQQKSRFSAVYVRQELARVMNDDLGISRSRQKLEEGLASIEYYLSICGKLHFEGSFLPYQAYSLHALLVLAKAVLLSALNRCETRGAHIREDFPNTEEAFRCATVISFDGGAYRIKLEEEDRP